MSELFNPYAVSVLGSPLPQKAPPQLRAEGRPMTRPQLDMARFVFGHFLEQARLSYVPNPTQHGFLPDGSRFRIVDVAGAVTMQVWPVHTTSGELLGKIYGGFVFEKNGNYYIVDVKIENAIEWYNHSQEWGMEQIEKSHERNICKIKNLHNFVIDAPWGGYLYKGVHRYEPDYTRDIRLCAKGEMYLHIANEKWGFVTGVTGFYKDEDGHHAGLIGVGDYESEEKNVIKLGTIGINRRLSLNNPPPGINGWPPEMQSTGCFAHDIDSDEMIYSRDGKKIILKTIETVPYNVYKLEEYIAPAAPSNPESIRYTAYFLNSPMLYPYNNNDGYEYVYKDRVSESAYVTSAYKLHTDGVVKINDIRDSFITIPEKNKVKNNFYQTNSETVLMAGRFNRNKIEVPVKYSEKTKVNFLKGKTTAGDPDKNGRGGTFEAEKALEREFEATYKSKKVSYASYGFDFSGKQLDCKYYEEVDYLLTGSIENNEYTSYTGHSKKSSSFSRKYPDLYYPIGRSAFDSKPGASILTMTGISYGDFHSGYSGEWTKRTKTTSKETFARKVYFSMNELHLVVTDDKVSSEVEVSMGDRVIDYSGDVTSDAGITSVLRVEVNRTRRNVLHYDQYLDLVVYLEYSNSHNYTCSAFANDFSDSSKAHPLPNKEDIKHSDLKLIFLHRGKVAMEQILPAVGYSGGINNSYSFAPMTGSSNDYIFQHPECYETKAPSGELVDGTLKIIASICDYLSFSSPFGFYDNILSFTKSPSTGVSMLTIKHYSFKKPMHVFVSKNGVYLVDKVLDGFDLTIDDFTNYTI